jgi:hypothetical protein
MKNNITKKKAAHVSCTSTQNPGIQNTPIPQPAKKIIGSSRSGSSIRSSGSSTIPQTAKTISGSSSSSNSTSSNSTGDVFEFKSQDDDHAYDQTVETAIPTKVIILHTMFELIYWMWMYIRVYVQFS